jgi:hypothetical protein
MSPVNKPMKKSVPGFSGSVPSRKTPQTVGTTNAAVIGIQFSWTSGGIPAPRGGTTLGIMDAGLELAAAKPPESAESSPGVFLTKAWGRSETSGLIRSW